MKEQTNVKWHTKRGLTSQLLQDHSLLQKFIRNNAKENINIQAPTEKYTVHKDLAQADQIHWVRSKSNNIMWCKFCTGLMRGDIK